MKSVKLIAIAAILAVALAWVAQAGVFYQTGSQWFQACWSLKNLRRSAETAEESMAWSKCSPTAQRAVYSAGIVPSGDPDNSFTPAVKALNQACPSNFKDIPLFGLSFLAVNLIEASGGPSVWDRFMSPDGMIQRAFESKWPNCSSVAQAQGFPKIVARGEKWEFETPCKPCEVEAKEAEKMKQTNDAVSALRHLK